MHFSKMIQKNRKYKKIKREYITAIFLYYFSNYSYKKEDNFLPSFFNEELKLCDRGGMLNKLISKKFLTITSDGVYEITEKGHKFLLEKSDYISFFELAIPDIDICDYLDAKNFLRSDESFEGIMITLLLKKIEIYKMNDDYVGVKNLHYEIGELYEKLSYYPQAMYHFLTSLYYEVSGLEYYDQFTKYMEGSCTKKELERVYSYTCIDPKLIIALENIKDAYIDEMTDTIFNNNLLRINLCSKEMFKKLVISIINEDYKNYKWQEEFKNHFSKLVSYAENIK